MNIETQYSFESIRKKKEFYWDKNILKYFNILGVTISGIY